MPHKDLLSKKVVGTEYQLPVSWHKTNHIPKPLFFRPTSMYGKTSAALRRVRSWILARYEPWARPNSRRWRSSCGSGSGGCHYSHDDVVLCRGRWRVPTITACTKASATTLGRGASGRVGGGLGGHRSRSLVEGLTTGCRNPSERKWVWQRCDGYGRLVVGEG